MFRPFDTENVKSADIMMVGTDDGRLFMSIYDSFILGIFEPPIIDGRSQHHLAAQAACENSSTHSLLFEASLAGRSCLYLVPMDLRFVSSSRDLSLIASRSSVLHNLLRYISDVHQLMVAEFESTRDLPGKFLRNVNEDLQERENRNIVQALYHFVTTGHAFPIVKDWLVDELAERVRVFPPSHSD